MDPKHRTYRLTEAGCRALAQPALSVPCRRILRVLDGDTHYAVIARDMAMCTEAQVVRWLRELESTGLLESQAASDRSDLDFTGGFSLADLAAAAKNP